MEEGRCQYLRALAVVEVIRSNLDNDEDLGDVHCTWAVWHSSVPTSVTWQWWAGQIPRHYLWRNCPTYSSHSSAALGLESWLCLVSHCRFTDLRRVFLPPCPDRVSSIKGGEIGNSALSIGDAVLIFVFQGPGWCLECWQSAGNIWGCLLFFLHHRKHIGLALVAGFTAVVWFNWSAGPPHW